MSSRAEGGGARWEGGSLFSTGPGSHYFHVADWGMERGGIMSRRYSRWRSTAEEVLCTAKLGLTNARAPPATGQSERPQRPWSGEAPGRPPAQLGPLGTGGTQASLGKPLKPPTSTLWALGWHAAKTVLKPRQQRGPKLIYFVEQDFQTECTTEPSMSIQGQLSRNLEVLPSFPQTTIQKPRATRSAAPKP